LTLGENSRIKLFLAFSFYTNLIKLFKTTPSSGKSGIIGCLNGIRVISMIWIMLGHRHGTYSGGQTINMTYFWDWYQNYSSMLILSGSVAVDTFFLLSGFLVTRSVLKELDKRKTLNVPYIYLHRYLRLTPSLAMLIFVQVTLYKYIGSGPNWKSVKEFGTVTCEKNWWVALLYIHNYFRKDQMVS
jgi:peptidoglycan/LPS O-acetylase OafA/YrhL